MSATIIRFPIERRIDRSGVVADCAGDSNERHLRAQAVDEGLSTDRLGASQGEEQWVGQAHHVLDHVEDMIADGEAAEAGALCERATWRLLDAAYDIDDTVSLIELVARLRPLHRAACHAAPPEPVRLADFVYDLAHSDQLGVLHDVIDPYVELLGPTGLAAVRRRVQADQDALRRLSSIGRRIEEFRLQPILTSLAKATHPSAV